jgi:Cdc6-like AAA superfamily ATPase
MHRMNEQVKKKKIFECGKAFSPKAPVNTLQLFKGRREQLQKVLTSIAARGNHVVIFGDRGVGKTSLTNILKDAIEDDLDQVEVVKVNCNANDTFESVWRRILSEIMFATEYQDAEDDNEWKQVENPLSDWLQHYKTVGSGEIKNILKMKCSETYEIVIAIDEFDRLDQGERRMFADTIKELSDYSVNVTIIIIGVANDINVLIGEHRSIERCLTQVYMPPMTKSELKEIIDTALRILNMKIEQDAKEVIVSLSRGYPYYTHLLGYEASVRAVKLQSNTIQNQDIRTAIQESLKNAQASVRDDYNKAADGQRKGTRYPAILLACATADTDEYGYFKPPDVKYKPVVDEHGEGPEVDCSEYLNRLSTDVTRGLILERSGEARKYKYRFKNALIKPYIIIKGIKDGIVSNAALNNICENKVPPNVTKSMFGDYE